MYEIYHIHTYMSTGGEEGRMWGLKGYPPLKISKICKKFYSCFSQIFWENCKTFFNIFYQILKLIVDFGNPCDYHKSVKKLKFL